MCVRYAGLSFSPTLLEGKGLAASQDMLVGAAVPAQPCCSRSTEMALRRVISSGERLVAAAAERAMRGAMEEGVAGIQDDKDGNEELVEDNA